MFHPIPNGDPQDSPTENTLSKLPPALAHQLYPQFYIEHLEINQNRTGDVMGDQINTGDEANIINKSSNINNSQNRSYITNNPEVTEILSELTLVITNLNNAGANALLNELKNEMDKEQPSKGALEQIWYGLKAIVPTLETAMAIGASISAMISLIPFP